MRLQRVALEVATRVRLLQRGCRLPAEETGTPLCWPVLPGSAVPQLHSALSNQMVDVKHSKGKVAFVSEQ